jgi:RNA polymerase-binding transcription factor DksA
MPQETPEGMKRVTATCELYLLVPATMDADDIQGITLAMEVSEIRVCESDGKPIPEARVCAYCTGDVE